MPKKISPELRDRAVRLVVEHQQDYPSKTAAGASQAGPPPLVRGWGAAGARLERV